MGWGAPPISRVGLSEEDLERALRPVQADRVALILDCCRSGKALGEHGERQGPLNSPGLAQLAWEKGMEVLAASQSQESAQEAWEVNGLEVGHGLLTFTLAEEGLEKASWRGDELLVRSWMDYACQRVPQILGGEANLRRVARLRAAGGGEGSLTQTPRVFHRRQGGGEWPVSRRGGRLGS